jgi:putative transposase
MGVSYSGYYAYASGKSYLKSEQAEMLAAKVKEVYWVHKRRYGSRRISIELTATGIKAGRYRVRSLMRKQDLRAIQPRSFVPRTTVSDNRRASLNLLKGAPPTEPRAVLVGDITYLPLFGGKWCYLASWQDKVSKRVVGWKVGMRMTDDLVIEALEKALVRGLVAPGAIIHSDRGSQYTSLRFRKLLRQHGLRQSMSGKGNCYDNAQAESFWARFKTELVDGGVFRNVAEAISETFSYIEGYYNRIRRHSSLGYLSPIEFERKFDISKNTNAGESNRKALSVRVVSSFT